MNKSTAQISLVIATLAALGAGVQPAAAGPATQSASGFGKVHLGLPFRNFAFSATKSSGGT